MRKKIHLICSLLLSMVLLLSGCAQSAASDDAEQESNLIVIGFSQVGAESDWRVAHTESIRSTFSEENGYELIYSNAQQKQENQISALRRFILQKVDYILLAPVTETGWDSVLLEAKEAGIPVILVDRMIDIEDESLYTAFVGSDFYSEGCLAMQWLETHLEEQGRADEPVQIIHVYGTLDSSAQVGRTTALMDALERHSNWELVAQLDGDFTQAKSCESMLEQLQISKDVDVVYCENDNIALGVLQAMEEMGMDPAAEGVTIISFDATRSGLTACLEGKIDLDVDCNPLQGPQIEALIRQLEAGETVEKYTYVSLSDPAWFDADNITQEIVDNRLY